MFQTKKSPVPQTKLGEIELLCVGYWRVRNLLKCPKTTVVANFPN